MLLKWRRLFRQASSSWEGREKARISRDLIWEIPPENMLRKGEREEIDPDDDPMGRRRFIWSLPGRKF